ncbi:hypothetical protein ACMD2_16953, partial [Ananas comosus]
MYGIIVGAMFVRNRWQDMVVVGKMVRETVERACCRGDVAEEDHNTNVLNQLLAAAKASNGYMVKLGQT